MPQEGLLKVDNVTKADYELLKDGSEVILLYITLHMSGLQPTCNLLLIPLRQPLLLFKSCLGLCRHLTKGGLSLHARLSYSIWSGAGYWMTSPQNILAMPWHWRCGICASVACTLSMKASLQPEH